MRHLRDELKLFPNLKAIVVLGNDAYLQFQRFVLGRPASEIKSFESLLKGQGWHGEATQVPALGSRSVRQRHPGVTRTLSAPTTRQNTESGGIRIEAITISATCAGALDVPRKR